MISNCTVRPGDNINLGVLLLEPVWVFVAFFRKGSF